MRRVVLRGAIALGVALGLWASGGGVSIAASATVTTPGVSTMTVADTYSTLTLTFDRPIPKVSADALRSKITAAKTTRVVAASAPTYEYFWCGTQISETDSNGTFDLNRICSGLNQIRWTYQIGPIPRAIIVGNVVERGLDFWIDGQPQSRNATHTEPAGYFFHGTMSKISTGHLVQYQDYFKFKVNYNGNVGTGTITIAGQGKTY